MAFGFYGKRRQALLPHPQIPLSVLLVIENALCAAWNLIRAHPRPAFKLSTANEDEITLELHEALYDRIFNKGIVDGFNRQLFSTIFREPKIRNYNYGHPDRMPDLLVSLVGRAMGILNTQDGVFIECKPIDAQHSVMGHYWKKGLVRFISGDYAWAMTNAMMVGYTRTGYTITPKLTDVLKALRKGPPNPAYPRPCRRSKAGATSERVYFSEHARRFKYRETGNTAMPITIRHLWLKRD